MTGDLARAVPRETACSDKACSIQTRRHCRFPCSSARTSASATRAYPEGRWGRLACGVQVARRHESDAHVELARTRVPAVPSPSRGVVVPRLERAPATLVDAVRDTSVRTGQLHTAAAAAGLTALLALHLGAADAAGPASMTARALVVFDQARRYLVLAYGSSPTQFMGCMIGPGPGPLGAAQRLAPPGGEPGHSTRTPGLA